MICYLDRSFCTASRGGCGTTTCSRFFTEEHAERARAWWGNDSPPVAFADYTVGCPLRTPPPELAPADREGGAQ